MDVSLKPPHESVKTLEPYLRGFYKFSFTSTQPGSVKWPTGLIADGRTDECGLLVLTIGKSRAQHSFSGKFKKTNFIYPTVGKFTKIVSANRVKYV